MKILYSLFMFAGYLAAANPCHAFQEASTDTDTSSQALDVGSDAPSLEISDWVSDGEGKFEKVTDFKPGNVYVVEFWATWCPPCIAAMPHISELQTEYADQGVQFISVSDESLEKVEKFLERKVKGSDETYGDLTANYCLTTDPDESVKKSYMRAAGESGIPVAFVVGKTGKIEWIGHPNGIKKPLEQVVADEWDRDAAKVTRARKIEAKRQAKIRAKRRAEEEANLKIEAGEIENTMKLIERSIMANKMDKAVEQFDEAIALNTGEDKDFLNMKKYQVMEKAGMEGSDELFAMLAEEVTTKDAKADLAWSVAKLKLIGAKPTQPTIDKARVLIDEVVAEDDDALLLDIQSRLAHFQGKLDEAIEIRIRSLETAPPKAKKNFEKALEELKTEKAEAGAAESEMPDEADEKMEPKKEATDAE